MLIDLTKISQEAVMLDNKIEFTREYFEESGVLEIKNAYVTGKIYMDVGSDLYIGAFVTGVMILQDSITLEPIEEPFTASIDEIIEENNEYYQKKQNTLDIMGILWQNIVLEVPIARTHVKNYEKLKGEGWELKDENEKRIDPRLSELNKLLDTEGEK